MKQLFLSLLFLVTVGALSQGNLQFNQVIVYDVPISSSQLFTVPAGKVWKIESVGMGSSGSQPALFLRNAAAQNIAHFSSTSAGASVAYPFWLSAGFVGSFYNYNPSYRCCVSIIEFNVL